MVKTQRLSEKWFHRGLWLVAVIFASFLVGLGGQLVGDLPAVETYRDRDEFIPAEQAEIARADKEAAEQQHAQAEAARDQARSVLEEAQTRYRTAHDTFRNWLATRQVTEGAEHNHEVTTRTHALDLLKQEEARAQRDLDEHVATLRQARLRLEQAEQTWSDLQEAATPLWEADRRASEMRVFFYRLALTLPLLLVAGWLFVRHRKGQWWPFVWGFVFFALFTFFVELVPYLPDYGGYVRYAVGIVVTVLIGRQAILALQRYLEQQRQAETLPAAQRQVALAYDAALGQLAKGVCPGCERPVELKDGQTDFCPHCGIGLYTACHHCHTRKSTFTKFCFRCGTAAAPSEGDKRP